MPLITLRHVVVTTRRGTCSVRETHGGIMYSAIKVGIAALAAGLGVGAPFGLWALQRHHEPPTAVAEAPADTARLSTEVVPVIPPAFSSPRARVQAPQPIETTPAEPEVAASE